MPAAYVVKTVVEGQPFPGVFGELEAGKARIGWSYQDTLIYACSLAESSMESR